MMYMRGLKAEELEAIFDFIYHGEANIYQENLDAFLILAEELQLKGLERNEDHKSNVDNQNLAGQKTLKPREDNDHNQENKFQLKETKNMNQSVIQFDNGTLVVSGDTSFEALKVRLDSMMERSDIDDKWKCIVCGKESTTRRHMRSHIETHIEGMSYPCDRCGKVSRSSNALQVHVSTYHRK